MFGLEMIFKAIGLDDAAIAELKSLLDPQRLKAGFSAASERLERLEKDVGEIKTLLIEMHARQGLTELVAHGGQVMHPNFERALNRQLMIDSGVSEAIIDGESHVGNADDTSRSEHAGSGSDASAN